ncbi:FMN-binding negative transcriptional regulator [Caballeronia sp. GAFFF1]|uniref:FMN-binding negative transcriptional regulator n=1 Tax=Caballeronia sp. GAFFF1 TaxID=2921779 RepID=UPI0020298EA6|nr:FMN-binding negative transcriptional regulator [Caballeronia sp. GAFFF1]
MYVPPQFTESDVKALHALIVHRAFGTLVTHGRSGLDANHLPFELYAAEDGYGTLHAHVARANSVWRDVSDNDEAMVIFNAGDAYISPSWYPSKQEHHKQVPTWNYVVVHAHGRIRVRDDKKFVRGVVARLTRTHEAQEPKPWKMGDAPPDYLEAQLDGIVGLEVEITRLVGKRKLGQHKEARDIRGPAEALVARGNLAIGDEMLACAAKKGV